MRIRTTILTDFIRIVTTILVTSMCLFAGNYYVADPRGPDGVAGTGDDIDASDNYSGTLSQPFATLTKAGTVAAAGDTIMIMGGIYNHTLRPKNSGTVGTVITYKSHDQNDVIIKDTPGLSDLTQDEIDLDQEGRQYGIYLYGLSHIVIQGLSVTEVTGWARIVKCRNVTFQENNFTKALGTGTTGSVKFMFSDNNKVLNNTLHDGNDNLLLIHSDSNLVAENDMRKGRHSIWCIRAGNFNVIKNNYFHNEIQKIGEIYDAENDPPLIYDTTKYNLVEGNEFAKTPSSGDASPYAGIQFAGQRCIIRNNLFYETVGPGFDFTLYSDEARYNYENRIYHNVFYKTDFAGVSITGSTNYTFHDNILINNIFYQSLFVANDQRWTWYTEELEGKPVQVLSGRQDGFLFENNNFFNQAPDEAYLITYGERTSSSNPPQHEVAWWESNHPDLFKVNLEKEPQFVNAAGHDFKLTKGSPMINAGTFLTQTLGQGSGKEMPVVDVKYFYSGFGIAGETGDRVQLAGQTETAKIVFINYTNNILTLDQNLTWTDSLGVSLGYSGGAPDIGAFEYDETGINGKQYANNNQDNIIISVSPDPVKNRIQIIFTVSRNEEVAFRLFALDGRLIESMNTGKIPAGTRTIHWDINTPSYSPISNGMYVVVMQTHVAQAQVKILYIR